VINYHYYMVITSYSSPSYNILIQEKEEYLWASVLEAVAMASAVLAALLLSLSSCYCSVVVMTIVRLVVNFPKLIRRAPPIQIHYPLITTLSQGVVFKKGHRDRLRPL